jgi:hypothetical protein
MDIGGGALSPTRADLAQMTRAVASLSPVWHFERSNDPLPAASAAKTSRFGTPAAAVRLAAVWKRAIAEQDRRAGTRWSRRLTHEPKAEWFKAPITPQQLARIWNRCGIVEGDPRHDRRSSRSLAQMIASRERAIAIAICRVADGWLTTAWLGEVRLESAGSAVLVGGIAGLTQADAWEQFSAFLDGAGVLYASTSVAADVIWWHRETGRWLIPAR